jgi:hypothetical protein
MITPGTTKCPSCEEFPYSPKDSYSPAEIKGIKMMGLNIPKGRSLE